MTRSEASGLTLAVVGHLVLFVLVSVGFLATPNPLSLKPTPIEVSITDEAALVSQAPELSSEAPAERQGEVEALEPEPVPEAAAEPEPAAQPRPTPPRPAPAPDASERRRPDAPSSRPTGPTGPTRRDVRPTGRITDPSKPDGPALQPTGGDSPRPPATAIGPEVKSSINALIQRQLKPHWRSPTGADVQLLRTIVELRLNTDGSLAAEPRIVRTEGINASNRPQVALHREQAIKAIKLAAPFKNLPEEYYEYWKRTGPAFDRRLSQ